MKETFLDLRILKKIRDDIIVTMKFAGFILRQHYALSKIDEKNTTFTVELLIGANKKADPSGWTSKIKKSFVKQFGNNVTVRIRSQYVELDFKLEYQKLAKKE